MVKVMVRQPVTDPAVVDFIKEMVIKNPKPENCYNLALMIYDLRDGSRYKEMAEYLMKASDEGHADARAILGDCYFYGLGVEQDQKKAVELFISAAEMGSLMGCYSAGNELLIGKVVDADYQKAYTYLKKVADEGDDRAINSLGLMYLFGYHVKKDLRKAKRYFKKSAMLGNEQAIHNYGKLKAASKDADFSDEPILKPSEMPKEDVEG